jgi:hypothetical protein
MTEYLIKFDGEWIPSHLTEDDFVAAGARVRALRREMTDAGVLVFTGGLDIDEPVFNVDPASGEPVFTDGPFAETKEHLGGICIVDVADEEQARHWAGKVATACGWPQEVHVFRRMGQD